MTSNQPAPKSLRNRKMARKAIILLLVLFLLLLLSGVVAGVFYALKYLDGSETSPESEPSSEPPSQPSSEPSSNPSSEPSSTTIPDGEAQLNPCETQISKKDFLKCPAPKMQTISDQVGYETESEIAKNGHMSGWKPLLYDMHLKFMNKRDFSGNVSISMRSKIKTNRIRLDLDSSVLSVQWDQLRIRRRCSKELICPTAIQMHPRDRQGLNYKLQYVEIIFSHYFPPNIDYQIEIPHFHGSAYDRNKETGSIGIYEANRMGEGWALGTIFQMRGARTVFPCFDQPSLKRSVGVIVQDNIKESKMDWMLQEAVKITKFLSDMIQIPYALPALDFINVVPAPFWGIENFGLVTLDFEWMKNPAYDNVHTILVHEIVHQWLGNLVTIRTWEEICLQEGLTAYVTAYVANKLNLISGTLDIKMESLRNSAIQADRGQYPIIREFERTQQIADRCFQKPPVIFKMMDDAFGSGELTREFLRKLLKKYVYSNAGIHEWTKTYSSAADSDLAGKMLKSWFRIPGYPIMTASVDRATHTVTVTQKIYLNGTIQQSNGDIFVTNIQSFDSTGKRFSGIMEERAWSFPVSNKTDWVVLNKDGQDYYRTLYDAQNYRSILTCFNKDAALAARPDNPSCPLSPTQVGVVFKDFCIGLLKDQFPVESPESNLSKEVRQIWESIFSDLRNLTDASIRGQSRLSMGHTCGCCMKTKTDLEEEKNKRRSRWTMPCKPSWNNYCRKLKIMELLGKNHVIS